MCLPHQQPLGFPTVPTAQVSSSNVKITFVCSLLGYVMVITTVAMAPMENFTCAVRGEEWSEREQCCLAKLQCFYEEPVVLEAVVQFLSTGRMICFPVISLSLRA